MLDNDHLVGGGAANLADANLVDVDPAAVSNDMAVALTFRELDGVKLPQFSPVTASTGTGDPSGRV